MNEKLRRRLLEMKARDLRVREKLAKTGELFEGYAPEMEKVHRENAFELEKMIDRNGWLGKSLVGKDGAEAAWLIVQHAISLPEFQRKCLNLIRAAVSQGEAGARQAAFLEDRINFFEGEPQRYGTHFDWNDDGKMQVYDLENEAKVNDYRAEVGLNPLETLVWETDENPPEDLQKRQQEFLEWTKKTNWRK